MRETYENGEQFEGFNHLDFRRPGASASPINFVKVQNKT
jgi:hypothetical protein